MLFLLILIGLIAGLCGGFFGIGGGVVITPILVYFLGFSQKLSQGITLGAMVFPIAFPAAFAYWRYGNVDIKASAFIAIGFVIGSCIGGGISQLLPDIFLRKSFAILLAIIAVKMLLDK